MHSWLYWRWFILKTLIISLILWMIISLIFSDETVEKNYTAFYILVVIMWIIIDRSVTIKWTG